MKYATSSAFRQALEDRLRQEESPQAIQKQRKLVAFERFMMRLSDRWILKGGYALQLRTDSARTTQDIDLLVQNTVPEEIEHLLREEAQREIGDFFDFLVESTDQLGEIAQAVRFRITARLDSRVFERFHIDIGYHDSLSDNLVRLTPPDYLSFAEVDSRSILCYPVSQHLAEKIHAILATRANKSSRTKDMVDILLFASIETSLDCRHIRSVVQQVFKDRGTPLPDHFDHIPEVWRSKYLGFTRQTQLPFTDFNEAVQRVTLFLNPILDGTGHGKWHPEFWQWIAD